jgi:acyl-CoA thioesterase I
MMRKVLMAAAICLAGAAQAQERVIAALGDSLTQGYGLPEEDGFVPQLQRWLDAAGADVRLVNAGVSGDTTAGGLARVDWTLTEDVEGMIVALGGNDLLRGLDPGKASENLGGILDAAEARDVAVLLIGMEAPGNYGGDYKARFDAIYPDLAEAREDVVYMPDFFAGLRQEEDDLAALQQYFQPDGIHPNAEGVARIVSQVGPEVLELVEAMAD